MPLWLVNEKRIGDFEEACIKFYEGFPGLCHMILRDVRSLLLCRFLSCTNDKRRI